MGYAVCNSAICFSFFALYRTMLDFTTIVFYAFAAVAVAVSVGVVVAKNSIYAALFLVLAFVASAGLWLLLHAEFLAIVLVLVYVGAVMVLFLFVLMMLDINFDSLKEGFWRYFPLALLVIALFTWELVRVFSDAEFAPMPEPLGNDVDNTRMLGKVLYTHYVYAFELAAVILLVAIIAAVALTLRRRKQNTKLMPAEQQVQAQAQIRLTAGTAGTVGNASSHPPQQ